jgi:hypothetical protein
MLPCWRRLPGVMLMVWTACWAASAQKVQGRSDQESRVRMRWLITPILRSATPFVSLESAGVGSWRISMSSSRVLNLSEKSGPPSVRVKRTWCLLTCWHCTCRKRLKTLVQSATDLTKYTQVNLDQSSTITIKYFLPIIDGHSTAWTPLQSTCNRSRNLVAVVVPELCLLWGRCCALPIRQSVQVGGGPHSCPII